MEAAADTGNAPAPGAVLAEARERQGLSRAEVAQRLHMSPFQIEALEVGDYSRLPTGTFLRGFVRNYAKIVGADPEPLLAGLAQSRPSGPAPGIVVPSQNIRFDPLGQRLANPYIKATGVAIAFVVFGFAALYWWFFIRPEPPAVARKPVAEQGPPQQLAVAPQPAPAPVTVAPAPSEPLPPAAVAKGEPPKAEPARIEPPRAEAPKAEPAPAAPPAAEAKRSPRDRVIRLRFKGESWVEIRDGQGKLLLSKLNPPNSEAEVVGRPPFSVIVGNAPEVQMQYNDRDFPLEPHTKVAVARFNLE